MKRPMLVIFASAFLLLPMVAVAQSFEFPVERERLLQNHRGTLVIAPDGIEYSTTQKNESRSWRYTDIQQIKIDSPTELEILTYEDQRRMLGRARIYRFRLLEGKITPEVSALLVTKASRPVATSVSPVTGGEPKYETAVKHLHAFGGCEGALKIYPDHMTFESTDKPEHSRYWRYSDIQSFSHPMRYRFDITTFEDKFGGPTKVYDLQLKEDLPASAYDYIWVRVNPVELYPYGRAATEDALAVNRKTREEEQPRRESHNPNPDLVTAPGLSVVAEGKPRVEPRMQSEKPEAQTARVILTEQGYKPDSIRLQRGIPARITFVRQTESTCGTEIVLPAQGIKRALPLNKPVVVAFTPNKSGEFSFTCGMGMLRGKIVVQERPSETSDSGIEGEVSIGPMCPVERLDRPCPDKPFEASIEIQNQDNQGSQLTIRSGKDGRFRIKLTPGKYKLTPTAPNHDAPPHAPPPQSVTVESGKYTHVAIRYDSGIR
ncbi:MAG: cupredoxin domain-containing protein [Blastocatellia bacterium]|nr:cupredoxin domain-containing protein [Blastocatellia bacterium]